jgi:hypothetical protein
MIHQKWKINFSDSVPIHFNSANCTGQDQEWSLIWIMKTKTKKIRKKLIREKKVINIINIIILTNIIISYSTDKEKLIVNMLHLCSLKIKNNKNWQDTSEISWNLLIET